MMSEQDFYDKFFDKFAVLSANLEKKMDDKLNSLPCVKHGEQLAAIMAKDEERGKFTNWGRTDKTNNIATLAIIISVIVGLSTIYNIFFK